MRNAVLPLLVAHAVFAQSPIVHRVSPLAVPAGKTTEVRLVAERLGEITDVWCSAEEVRIAPTNEARLLITARPEAAGIVAIRVGATNGVSEFAMLVIDALRTVQENGSNKTKAAAQRLETGTAAEGISDELGYDYYRIDAQRGNSVSVEIFASRLGSKLDPVLRILDTEGGEVAFCEDAPGAGRDCRITFRPRKTGAYLLEVRDVTYGGGPQHFYRLRVGEFSFPTCTYPLAAAPGDDVLVLGPPGQRIKPAKAKLPTAAPSYLAIDGSFVALRADELPYRYFERESNDTEEDANSISLPHLINGRFEKARDRDCFAIEVKSGERWVFATRSRTFGSPCDVFLELGDAKGKLVAESNPAGVQDTSLTHEFKGGGRHFLIARELANRGAPDFAYQIDARLFEPGFTLGLDDDKFEAKPSGEVTIVVSCARSDFSEKIALELDGLPPGFIAEGAGIDAKKTNATIKVKVPEDAHAGELFTFRVIGRAGEKRVIASTLIPLRRSFTTMLFPHAELDGVVTLGITAGDPAPKPRRRRT